MKKRHFLLFFVAMMNTVAANATNSGDSSTYYLQKAKESKDARKIWEAEKNFLKAVSFNPENETVRIEFAAYYCEQRKYVLASQQYNALLQKNPTHPVALPKIIDISFLLRKWEDVVQYADRAFKSSLKIDMVGYLIGKSYYELENYGLSKKYLVEQIIITPTHKETVALLGKVYIELSNYTEAIAIYHKCLEASPDNPELMYELGLLYSAQKKDREAVKYFEMAAAKGLKQDIAFLENLGYSYLEFDIEKGVEVLNKVLLKKPGDAELLTQIAQAYYRKENYAVAFDYYYKIYLNDNKNAKSLYMSGVSLIRKGDKTKGQYVCDQAIAIDPSLAQLKSSKSIL
ncbi:MAG: tetratricopeptide repeat protein [Chitinophagaceae bacterium]|nr:tetratricopeptide repeat protein [Chitinophagaceae bacterium]